ncbi:MAG: hypothetical protein NXI12_04170 [Alphaproteobacteria bacterium]|nr:hypothetical protein [Alphaproteobacteria bacterium]
MVQPDIIYRASFGLILLHHVFETEAQRGRAGAINLSIGSITMPLLLAVYLNRAELFAPFTLLQSLGILVLAGLFVAWLTKILIYVACRPKSVFVRWPTNQSRKEIYDDTVNKR